MSDAAWITELKKPENETLRQAGDVEGLFAKYTAPTGPRTWTDASLSNFLMVVGDEWLSTLSDTIRNEFFNAHVVSGMVTLSIPATRAALAPSTTPPQREAFQAKYSTQQQYFEVLSLPTVTRRRLLALLRQIDDTPTYDFYQRRGLIERIKSKANLLDKTTLANLELIDSLIGQ